VAAHGIGLRIQSLAFVPSLGVSQAIGAMVGNALGRGDVDEAREVVRGGMMLSTGIATVIGLAIVFGAAPVISIFEVDPATELGRYSILWMQVLGWGMPVVGIHIALIGMLRGAGATNTSLMINIIGTVVIQVPLSWFLGFVMGWGAFGIWVAMPISFVVRMCLGVVAYRRGAWARAGWAGISPRHLLLVTSGHDQRFDQGGVSSGALGVATPVVHSAAGNYGSTGRRMAPGPCSTREKLLQAAAHLARGVH